MPVYRVVLDPGHGGKSRWNVGPTGYVEADGVLDIALKVRDILKKYTSIGVYMTRTKDETLDAGPRVDKVNLLRPAIVVSIHTNAGPPAASGTEVYCSINDKPGTSGYKLAELVVNNICQYAGTYKRGIKTKASNSNPKKDYYFMIRNVKAVSIIVECAFHTNPKEEELLKTDLFRNKCAQGIAKGIVDYFGITWNEDKRVFLEVVSEELPAYSDIPKTVKTFVKGDYLTGISEKDGYYELNINGQRAWVDKKYVRLREGLK